MAINFKNICKAIKASESFFVQYTEDGKRAQVSNGKFVVELPISTYTKELLTATATALPTEKGNGFFRKGKKAEYVENSRIGIESALTLESPHATKRTGVLLELPTGVTVRLYQVDNGENVWVNKDYTDFSDGAVVGGNRFAPIIISDANVRIIVAPMRVEQDLPMLMNTPEVKPTVEVEEEDEPLTAPSDEVEEEATEEAEEATEEDELDTPESIAEAMVSEGEEEKPDTIDDWEVPSDVFVIVKPSGTMWVYGKTKPIKEELKRRNFHYAPKWEGAKKAGYPKSGWYRKPALAEAAAD